MVCRYHLHAPLLGSFLWHACTRSLPHNNSFDSTLSSELSYLHSLLLTKPRQRLEKRIQEAREANLQILLPFHPPHFLFITIPFGHHKSHNSRMYCFIQSPRLFAMLSFPAMKLDSVVPFPTIVRHVQNPLTIRLSPSLPSPLWIWSSSMNFTL